MKSLRREAVFVFLCVFIVTLLFSLTNQARAQTGSLYFSPSRGTVSVDQLFSVVLRVNTGGTAINAAEGSIIFDQSKISIVSISKSGSIFTIWTEEPKFSNAEGEISFAGGVPNPGYSGSNGLILTINFKTKAITSTNEEATDISLVSGGILANDGYGTNILSSLGKATYSIKSGIIQPTIPPTETMAPAAGAVEMTITSSTHPDSSKWYSNSNPLFKWNLPSGVREVILVLSKRANSPPIINYIPPISEKLLTEINDGEWYLNGRFRTASGLGPVTSFKFNIDTRSPGEFSITRLDTNDSTNPKPELLFESSDELSGIDHYELTVNNGEAENISVNEASRTYAMPLQTPGKKDVEIIAFDKAGNKTSARLTIQIESIEVPRLDRVTVQIKEGEPLIVEGAAEPNQKVLIYVIHENDNPSMRMVETAFANHNGSDYNIYETKADENGKFALTITDLSVGRYKLYAKAQDERGAISNPSNTMPAEVKKGLFDFIFRVFDWISDGFNWLVDILSRGGLFIAFIAALVGFILVLVELVKIRAGKWFKKKRDWIAAKIARKKSVKKMAHIIKDMQDEIKLLNQITKDRILSKEEEYLKSKLLSYIKMLKHVDRVDKETD